MPQKVCPVRGEYFVMNRQELLGFFLQKRRNNTILCKNCKKCYNCNRFEYIKEQLKKMRFSRDSLVQSKNLGHSNLCYGKFLRILKNHQTMLIKTLINLKFISKKQLFQIF